MLDKLLVQRLSVLAPHLYPLKAPKNYTQPAVIYNCLNVSPIDSLARGVPDCAYSIYQIDVYDESYLAAYELATRIRDNLVAWSDANVQAVTWTGTSQTIDDTTEVALFRSMSTFLVFANV